VANLFLDEFDLVSVFLEGVLGSEMVQPRALVYLVQQAREAKAVRRNEEESDTHTCISHREKQNR
jgi:hypothetical protein